MLKREYRVAVLTASDKGAAGLREDESGPLVCKIMRGAGYTVAETALLPDDRTGLAARLKDWCDTLGLALVLTTGGTGLAPRDQMPEATLEVAERLAPGIPEAMRAHSLTLTPRGMLSRGVAAIRGQTLIINLPGSPVAVRQTLLYILPALEHALDMLGQNAGECAAGARE
jgi:molybdenum cofactor synthesis domain-containing protein